jgi:hypothetical protein
MNYGKVCLARLLENGKYQEAVQEGNEIVNFFQASENRLFEINLPVGRKYRNLAKFSDLEIPFVKVAVLLPYIAE